MASFRFSLHISADEFVRYYDGSAQAVIVRAHDGRRLQLPARNFRPYVTAEGIHGEFEITLDGHNKLLEMKRLS